MIQLRCNTCGYQEQYETEEDACDNGWREDESGDWYCSDCYDDCGCCGGRFPKDELEWSESQDMYICDHCREEHYERCQFCDQLYDQENDEGSFVLNRADNCEYWACDRCMEEQNRRGRARYNEDAGRWEFHPDGTEEGNMFQEHLHPKVWNEIAECPDCCGSNNRCARCLEKMAKEAKAEETTLWVYDTSPRSYHQSNHNHFKETKLRQPHEHPFLYYGVEWEVLFNSSVNINTITKEFIEATNGLFVAEFDRSVADQGNGIEFISRPLSYKKWMEESTYQLLQAGRAVLEKYHLLKPQPVGCGLHVHMSLQFFERNTKKSVKKIKSDIDWMFQIFQPEIEKISQRPYTKYCASKAYRLKQVMGNIRSGYGFNLNPQVTISKGNLTQSMGSGDTHHDAIIQTYKTIEVRTFKSPTEIEEILATIEFCRCIAHAARNMELNTKTTLGDIVWCKDSKYLPEFIKKTKVDTEKKFDNKLEVKI